MRRHNDLFCKACHFSSIVARLWVVGYTWLCYTLEVYGLWHILWLKRGSNGVFTSIFSIYDCMCYIAFIFAYMPVCCCIYFATISGSCGCSHKCWNILTLYMFWDFFLILSIFIVCMFPANVLLNVGTCMCDCIVCFDWIFPEVIVDPEVLF